MSDSEDRIPKWLAIDLLVICVPLAIFGLVALAFI